MTRRQLLAWVVLLAGLCAGCGVRPSGVITGGPAPTAPAEGANLYFLTNSALILMRRPTPQPLSPTQTLALLQTGPDSDERAMNLTTEVPADLDPISVTTDASGNLTVLVTADVTTLSTPAVDQIICTLHDALPTPAPITLTSPTATRTPRTCPLNR